MKKTCFKCKRTKELRLFYKHSSMTDGHLGKCKQCTKLDVRKRYHDPESNKRVREYEKKRWLNPERRKKALEYQRRRRARFPGKSRARNAVSNAIRTGKLTRLPCLVCGDAQSEAHHKDYRKPLEVSWLCRAHHLETEGKQHWS